MPRGRPKQDPSNPASGDGPSKMGAVRQALDSLGYDAKPPALDQFIQEHFHVVIPHNMISSYKSQLRSKKKKGKGGRRGRPPGSGAVAAISSPVKESSSTVTMKDLHEVKMLAGRLGISKLRKLVEVLA